MNDQELAAEARRVAPLLRERWHAAAVDRLAAELLRQMADRLDGPAPLTGYLIDGRLWHPSDVTIVRQGVEKASGPARCAACGHPPHPETPAECASCPEGYCEAQRLADGDLPAEEEDDG